MLDEKLKFEDVHTDEPYIDAEYSDFPDGEYSHVSEVAHVFMLYVPPKMRRKGIGTNVFSKWLAGLPTGVKRVRLKAADLGGGSSMAFWKKLGFSEAYNGYKYDEIENALVLGVNRFCNPVPECIEPGDDYRHWIEGLEDAIHLEKHPQKTTSVCN